MSPLSDFQSSTDLRTLSTIGIFAVRNFNLLEDASFQLNDLLRDQGEREKERETSKYPILGTEV